MGFLGTILFTIGVLIIDGSRETARRAFLWVRAKRPLSPRLWLGSDESGYRFLFLGLGILFMVAGGALILSSLLIDVGFLVEAPDFSPGSTALFAVRKAPANRIGL